MYKTAEQIADDVLLKLAKKSSKRKSPRRDFREEFPGSMLNSGLLSGAALGSLLAYDPRLAKKIPNDRLRAALGMAAGALMLGGAGALGTGLANRIEDY